MSEAIKQTTNHPKLGDTHPTPFAFAENAIVSSSENGIKLHVLGTNTAGEPVTIAAIVLPWALARKVLAILQEHIGVTSIIKPGVN